MQKDAHDRNHKKKLKKLTCRELNTSLMRYVKYVIWMLQRIALGNCVWSKMHLKYRV